MARIGVDIGGTSVKIGVVKGDKVLKETSIKSSKQGFEKVISDICDAILTLCKKEEVEFIGVGTRGLFENGKLTDRVLKAKDFDIESAIKKRFKNAKVLVTNDANAAAICELNFGELKGSKCGALVTYGTGVGCGIVINGKLFEGAHKNGGEIGRTLMGVTDLSKFNLDNGTYESWAATSSLTKRAKMELSKHSNSLINKMIKGNKNKLNAVVIFDAYEKKDPWAMKLIDEHVSYISIGIASLINFMDLDTLVLAGGISARERIILSKIAKNLRTKNLTLKNKCNIVISKFHNDAGLIGAANLK